MLSEKITREQYIEKYKPLGGFILVEKDIIPEKTSGGIIIAQNIQDKHVKYTMTGTVVSKSDFENLESEYDSYFLSKINLGVRVGFSSTVPLLSPLPPDLSFEGENRFVTLHVTDLLCIFE